MRVLMLLSNPYRPDYRVEREAKALLEEGHEIRILAWDREGGHKDTETVDGVSVLRFGPRAGYNDPFDMFVKLPLFLWRALLKSRNLDFDVVHAHDFDTLVLGRILSKFHSVKLVYDAHELYWAMVENSVPKWLRNVVERFERKSVSRADIVLTVTPQVASVLEGYGARQVVLVMNCEEVREPDVERIDQVRKAMLGTAGKLALCAGMLEPSRNMQMLIDVFAGLEGADIKLVVGGTGSLVSEISRAALIHDPRNTNIRLGISARLFNAMAAGKPVIVSDGTGNADIVREEGIGVVVPYDDAGEVKNAVLSLVEDEERLADIAEKGRRAAKERYNWGIMKRRLIRAYRDLGAD
jgi:glycosyltransferase involved in cell wall biosynthesis